MHTRLTGAPLESILLVDDSQFMRRANERSLTRAGYKVVGVGDGEEALRVADAMVPDLIVLDMLLPKLGGAEVLRALRTNSTTSAIPIVVLSSLPQKNAAKLLKEGAAAYFDKSSLGLDNKLKSLVQIVKSVLDERIHPTDHAEVSDIPTKPVADMEKR
jgi:CheY-like chemotaxis protein